jgi:hypothetical protein
MEDEDGDEYEDRGDDCRMAWAYRYDLWVRSCRARSGGKADDAGRRRRSER